MTPTPTETSPYDLLQERLRHDPWKMLVACVMLNQTSNVVVKQVIWSFFERWPDAESCVAADPDEICEHIRVLGLYNRRTKTIQRLSDAFSRGEYASIGDLPGVGKYALDSYMMFVDGFLVEDVTDEKLRLYLFWAKDHVESGRSEKQVPGASGGVARVSRDGTDDADRGHQCA